MDTKNLLPLVPWRLSDDQLRAMTAQRWTTAEQRLVRVISTRGDPRFLSQGFSVPGSSIVILSMPEGEMDAGPAYGGRVVDCRGYHRGAPLDGVAKGDCTQPGMNKLCFLVSIAGLTLTNPAVGPGGASVGPAQWTIGNPDGGEVLVAFNDTVHPGDNRGYLTQRLEVISPAAFAEEEMVRRGFRIA